MKDDWQFLRGCVRWAVLAVLGIAVPLAAEEQTIVLRDYLRQNWTNELVTYPFVAKEGTCREGSAMLTGPRGPVAVQLSDVECWPGTACVKSARLSFIADLAPLATNRYTLRCGDARRRRFHQRRRPI